MIWKDVEGYEGLYAVSDTGLVRGQNGNIMAPLSTGNGYWQVYLRNKGNKKRKKGDKKRSSLLRIRSLLTAFRSLLVRSYIKVTRNGKMVIKYSEFGHF